MDNPLIPNGWDVAWSSVWVAVMILAVVAFISLLRTRGLSGTQALLWILAIVFLPVIGSVLWFVWRGRRSSAPVRPPPA